LVATVGLALLAVVTACGETTGTIQGQLIAGGPPPGSNNPLAGTVVARSGRDASDPVAATAKPGPDGSYRLDLPPATYYVTGSASTVAGLQCEGQQVQVSKGIVNIVDILCHP
jgi:hypothetical protein